MKSHNKKCIIYFIAGAMIFGTVGAFAGQYIATENTFPVQLNGKDVATVNLQALEDVQEGGFLGKGWDWLVLTVKGLFD